jgi:methionyl-tRNA formyltransferase
VTLTVVYAGTPEFAVPALEALAASGCRIPAVLTQPDRPSGRGRALAPGPVKRAALALGLPVLQPATLRDPALLPELAAAAADVFVIAAYGLILPPAVLAIPRLGCLNIHASLLPRWRGAAPVQRAILAGDAATGVAIMRMEEGLDTGAVYASEPVAIAPADTAATLTARLATVGGRLLLATLTELAAGTARATPQPAAGVTYAAKITKSEAPLRFTQAAVELERQVRAFLPWPVAEARLAGRVVRVHEAQVRAGAAAPPGTIVAAGAAGIEVATGAGHLLLVRVQEPGRGVVTAAEFARACARTGTLVGSCFEEP